MNSTDLPLPLNQPLPRVRVTSNDGRNAAIEPGYLSARLMQHGSMELRWYAPQDNDPQVRHDRDEVYIIVSGNGVFTRAEEAMPFGEDGMFTTYGEERVAVQPGDALFVPAGTEHRFEKTSPDFGVWVIFYGPEGGERW